MLSSTHWIRNYSRSSFQSDLSAAAVVTMVLIPQCLAYSLLAGLPPIHGFFASLLPLVIYSLFGQSASLSLGPFAIVSIMNAAALGQLVPDTDPSVKVAAAGILALMSGCFLVGFGLLRLGFLANLMAFPVVTGFISASALTIAASQVPAFTGGDQFSSITLLLGLISLIAFRYGSNALTAALNTLRAPSAFIKITSKSTPLLVCALSCVAIWVMPSLHSQVDTVGEIHATLPALSLPDWSALTQENSRLSDWLISAAMIGLIGYVLTLTTGQTFALKTRQSLNPDREAMTLGLANISSGLTAGFPIAASLSRSAIAFNQKPRTPATSLWTALLMLLTAHLMAPSISFLPFATLAALIINAVISLIDLSAIKRIARYSRQDMVTLTATFLITLWLGPIDGLAAGVCLSILLQLYRFSRPHLAIIGKLAGSEHFRNVDRFEVETLPDVLFIRIDASLFFANTQYLEERITELVSQDPHIRHLVLKCSAVNFIDTTALEALQRADQSLEEVGLKLHLCDVKGPVLDRLKRSDFLSTLSGELFLSSFEAWQQLTKTPEKSL